jgi:ribonuclease VapC
LAVRRSVLDASALLAYLQDEPGADLVEGAIAGGATMSSVNLAEVLSLSAAHGVDPAALVVGLVERGLLGDAITVAPFGQDDAVRAAELRPATRKFGLSLADRACVALAQRLEVPVLSADTAWAHAELDVELRLIR